MTKSSEISPFLSSRLKVDSQLSNCSGGPDKEKTTFHYLDDFKEENSSKSDQKDCNVWPKDFTDPAKGKYRSLRGIRE